MAQTTTLSTATAGPQSPGARATQVNMILAALFSMSAGTTAPSVTAAFMPWMDISADPALLKMRNAANSSWITVGQVTAAGVWTWWHAGAALSLVAAFEEIGGLTEEAGVATNDMIAGFDVSVGAPQRRKFRVDNILKAFAGLSAIATPALANKLLAHDGSAVGHLTPQLILNTINLLGAIAAPNPADSLALYDADGNVAGKATVGDALNSIVNLLTEITTIANDDLLLVRLTGGGLRKIKKSNLATAPALVLVETRAITAVGTIDFDLQEDVYGEWLFVLDGVVPASDGAQILMRPGRSAGTSFESGNCDVFDLFDAAAAPTAWCVVGAGAGGLMSGVGSSAGEHGHAAIRIGGLGATLAGGFVYESKCSLLDTSGNNKSTVLHGRYNATNARVWDAARFLCATGNFEATGSIKMFGLKRAG